MPEESKRGFPAEVVEIINTCKVVINRGSEDGIAKYDKFLIYSVSDEEIIDPETGESLGKLELVKGRGQVVHVQEKMSQMESNMNEPNQREIIRDEYNFGPNIRMVPTGESKVREIIRPGKMKCFDNPKKGDKVKPL